MRKAIATLFMLTSIMVAQAQGTFTIEGRVENVDEGTLITLLRLDGRVGQSVAVDTVRNGCFHFEAETLGNETEAMELMGQGDKFPPMTLKVWARPGCHIRINGDNTLIRTWNVTSDVPEQAVAQAFVNDSRGLWDDFQRNVLLEDSCYQKYRTCTTEESKNAIRAVVDSLQKIENEISIRIDANTIRRMKQVPVDAVWLEQLERLAMSVRYRESYPYKEDVVALYETLNDEERQSMQAMNAYTCLFPPQMVDIGDEMADADLYDLKGNVYHLSDFKGKYILLDFWSRGCGPCIMALPEMKEVAELYKDRLTVISLSSDTRKGWEEASKTHEITWLNLSDLKGTNGLYARYDVRGIPNYVFISPEGRILDKWMGYGQSALKQKLHLLLDGQKDVKDIMGGK